MACLSRDPISPTHIGIKDHRSGGGLGQLQAYTICGLVSVYIVQHIQDVFNGF